ncbi:carbohydrate ABC transporter permease [Vallitalea okinawensis]|uniref:carbohydrate ABC transporter permease n=1 Tax=Vallitalea okinawensis TaxID=2078660 RepID=UPI000CFAAFB9|nr:carbohydrate ABC transporter permease [Vallitalea okinawensis]
MVLKESIGEKIFKVCNYTFLTFLGFSTFYPFFYILILSFNDGYDALKGGLYFWPRVFTLQNYIKAFEDPLILNAFGISLFRTVVGTFLAVLLTALAGYALARKDLPGRGIITFFFFFTTIFSGGLIPFFILLRSLHLTRSVWIYVLPYLYSFFNIVIMRTYFQTIPDEMRESAVIDGCGELGIFLKIYLPLSGPMLATITLFYGVGHWNDWFVGAFFVSDKSLKPAATLLQKILSETNFEQATDTNRMNFNINRAKTTPEALRMAFLMIITFPIICVYPFLQKYFVKGVMIGSVKG